MKCPSLEEIFAAADPYGPAAAAGPVRAHLEAGCAVCGEAVAWCRRVSALAAGDDSVDPPAWVLQRALRLLEAAPPGRRSAPRQAAARWRQVIAALVFDSDARVVPAGARAIAVRERQVLYRAGAYHIDLQLGGSPLTAAGDGAAAAGKGTVVRGQILRDDEFEFESVAGLELSLLRKGRRISATVTNRFGEFSLLRPKGGPYDLRIDTDEISITVVGLPVA